MLGAQISIVAVGDQGQALALRPLLEAMGHPVRILPCFDADGVNAALLDAPADDVVILSAQASSRGLVVNGSDIAMPQALAGVTFSDTSVLMSTVSATHESGLIQVILNAGGHLVAPNATPDARVIMSWIGACLLAADQGLAKAVTSANALLSAENHFSYG
jgi:hypothetical protein